MSRRNHSKSKKNKKSRIERFNSKEKNNIQENVKNRNRRAKNDSKKTIILILSVVVIICLIIVGIKLYEKNKTKKDNENIRNTINNTTIIDENGEERVLTRTEQIKELQKENEDIIGWLEILDTTISYPVLQGDDNSFYMTHNYKKEKSKDGSLFLDKDYDWEKHNSNILIYGHNNTGSTEMFAKLMEYKNESFYQDHKYIRFTTDKEDAEYEIISVFKSRVYNQDEKDVFRYYYFIDAKDEKEFNNYVKNAKKASLYNIEATAQFGEQLITLSTCDYSQKDGRFVVVAKKR